MVTENLQSAKMHLSRLVAKALEGEEGILANAGIPLVKLVPTEELIKPVSMG